MRISKVDHLRVLRRMSFSLCIDVRMIIQKILILMVIMRYARFGNRLYNLTRHGNVWMGSTLSQENKFGYNEYERVNRSDKMPRTGELHSFAFD